MPTCDGCKWWVGPGYRKYDGFGEWKSVSDGTYRWGDCRKNAPSVTVDDDTLGFPRSHQDDWCGEHQSKEPRA